MASDAEINMNVNIRGAANANREMQQLEKMAEFTEKDQYRLEVSTKNRLELIKVIRELEQSLKTSLQNKDTQSFEKYQEQLAVAKEQFEKLNQEEALTQILFAQQMQAGQQLVQNFELLGESVGDLSNALEDGTLNLTGMGNAIMQMGMAIKTGLGPIAIVTGALQIVQTLYNSYAQTKKKVAEAEKENAAILEAEKNLYNDLATARRDYDAQVELATSLKNLNTEYDGIKSKLEDSLRLIEESTRAEIVRLSILQDEEELKRTQERYELGRAFKRGDISDEEYRRRLILLEKEQATAAATKTAAEAQIKLDAATKSAQQKEASAKSAFSAWEQSVIRASAFDVPEADISTRQASIAAQRQTADTQKQRARELLKQIGLPETEIDRILQFGYIPESYDTALGPAMYRRDDGTFWDSSMLEVDYVLKNMNTAMQSAQRMQEDLTKLLGGVSPETYNQQRAIAVQEEERRRAEKDSANTAAREAWRAVRGMPTEGDIQNTQNAMIRQAGFTASQKILDLENDIAVAKADAERARKLADATAAVQSLSTQEIKAAISQNTNAAWAENTKDSAAAQDLLNVYNAELTNRQQSKTALAKDLFRDRVFDAGEIDRVFTQFTQAIDANNKALQETLKHVLLNGRKYAQTTKDVQRINHMLNDMQ